MNVVDLPQDLLELLGSVRNEMNDTPTCADLTARAFEADEAGDHDFAAQLRRLAEALN